MKRSPEIEGVCLIMKKYRSIFLEFEISMSYYHRLQNCFSKGIALQ